MIHSVNLTDSYRSKNTRWETIFYCGVSIACATVLAASFCAPTKQLAAATSKDNVLLDFTASWCGPCQTMSPIVSRLMRKGYPIRKIDIDHEPELAREYGVSTIPAFVLVSQGRVIQRVVGATDEGTLMSMLDRIRPASTSKPEIKSNELQNAPEELQTPFVAIEQPGDRQSKDVALNDKKPKSPLGLGRFGSPGKRGTSRDSATAIVRGQDDDRTPRGAATAVRIRVKANSTIDYGSGTIIDANPSRTVILTCGHVVRDLPKGSRIEVDFFDGQKVIATYEARLLKANQQADVALLTVESKTLTPSMRIASLTRASTKGIGVDSWGCSHGEPPTKETTRITAINRYKGPDNIECGHEPAQGRSGGGLFTTDDQLVGVCVAADREEHRGLYCGLPPIHDLIKAAGLGSLLPPEKEFSSGSSDLALATESNQESTPALEPESNFTNNLPIAKLPSPTMPLVPDQQAAREVFENSPKAEVVCIVTQPDGGSRIVVVNQASSKFLHYLLDELPAGPEAPSRSRK